MPLFVPADRPERYSKAASSGTDAVIIDLEDAVAVSRKDFGRSSLQTQFTDLPVLIRVNAYGTPWHEDDLKVVAALQVAGFILPKAESCETVIAACQAVGAPVIPLIETAAGLANARSLAATDGVVRLAFGSIDFCADLACAHLRDVLSPARFELVLASRLANIAAPLDGVTAQLDDLEMTFRDAAHARALGMMGKLCIHPTQIAEVKRAFSPSREEINWAEQIVASGDGAVTINGAMVDEPVRARARLILSQV